MSSKAERKRLAEQAAQVPAEAGVYRIVNRVTGRSLLGRSENLGGMRNRVDFARSTGSPTPFDHRLHADARAHGVASFEFEVVDTLTITPEMTPAQVKADLDELFALWSERADPATSY